MLWMRSQLKGMSDVPLGVSVAPGVKIGCSGELRVVLFLKGMWL
jgi:hypothetical protein